ncbi:Isochorismatase domain-containing protein 2 [Hypsizygus marmoreus]|uniref:Isochorismatase domain-containing protein 2 n=1 Tax=Hypsizygus marmoreus TaxID=39966 RepID=A0A369JGM7_HYPMA|nr:Isochorismatase domain-containing protein 2 [Hypsizygus marmoreus]
MRRCAGDLKLCPDPSHLQPTMPIPTPASTIFFLCDLQSVFRSSIPGFDHLIFTANKLIKLAKILNCEVVSCTQAVRALGPLDPAIDLNSLGPLYLGTFDKSTFSMVTPQVQEILNARPAINNVVLFGIESHICVLQTALALLAPTFRTQPYTPYVVADCLASHNAWEVPLVIDRLRQEGAIVTSSEGLGFQLVADAKHPGFKAFSLLTKETKEGTTRAGDALLLGKDVPALPVPGAEKSAL